MITPSPSTADPVGMVTIAVTATPTPGPVSVGVGVETAGFGLGSWLGIVLSATVMAALITGAINLWLANSKSRAEERARIRNTLAEAYQAYADYKEMPYAVRRRDTAKPADERLRLSTEIRAIQSRLSYYETWIAIEAPTVAARYSELLGSLRTIAGGSIRDAWNTEGIDSDASMNMPAAVVDLSALKPLETAYRTAVADYLAVRRVRR